MADNDIYKELAEMINREDVVGIPESPSMLKVLSLQFTPEEAGLAIKIGLTGGTLDELSQKLDMDREVLSAKLNAMADKGTMWIDPGKENPVCRVLGSAAPGLVETGIWGVSASLTMWNWPRICTRRSLSGQETSSAPSGSRLHRSGRIRGHCRTTRNRKKTLPNSSRLRTTSAFLSVPADSLTGLPIPAITANTCWKHVSTPEKPHNGVWNTARAVRSPMRTLWNCLRKQMQTGWCIPSILTGLYATAVMTAVRCLLVTIN
jgi:hypothetical protein